jgi:hypothetical protein
MSSCLCLFVSEIPARKGQKIKSPGSRIAVGFYLMIFADLVMQSPKTVRTDTGVAKK